MSLIFLCCKHEWKIQDVKCEEILPQKHGNRGRWCWFVKPSVDEIGQSEMFGTVNENTVGGTSRIVSRGCFATFI